MKIEIIVEVAGMEVGTIKNVPNNIAENLIARELAKEVKEKKVKEVKEEK